MSPSRSETPSLASDLVGDWGEIARAHLESLGYPTGALGDPENATIALLNVQRHRVPRRPRCVHRSRELADPQDELSDLIAAIERGDDLTPFQSKLHGPFFNDHLLNDWGIQHFHLVPSATDTNDKLLFAWVTDDDLYAIQMSGHMAGGYRTFEDQQLVEILHQNWPDLLAPCRAPGVVPGSLSGPHTPTGRGIFRAAGFLLATQTSDGTVYAAPGGGAAMGGIPSDPKRKGLSVEVAMQRNRCMEFLTVNQRSLATKGRAFVDIARSGGSHFEFVFPIHLRLAYHKSSFYVRHEDSEVTALLAPSPVVVHTAGDAWLTGR
jgi:hypothetical protein